jgi:hypothetical protein
LCLHFGEEITRTTGWFAHVSCETRVQYVHENNNDHIRQNSMYLT